VGTATRLRIRYKSIASAEHVYRSIVLFIAVPTIFPLFHMGIEEKMLIEVFGDEYREYQRNTKKIIPYVY